MAHVALFYGGDVINVLATRGFVVVTTDAQLRQPFEFAVTVTGLTR